MKQLYKDLSVCSVTPEYHARTCGYWYIVQTFGATPHTAFAERAHLDNWLNERGLTLKDELPHTKGEHGYTKILGEYTRESHMSYDEFYNLAPQAIETKILDNADYTLGLITTDETGHKTIHHLNCNLKYRPVYPYAETRANYG